jgi:peptide deformylase
MALLSIMTYGNPVLRKKAEPVSKVTPELAQLAKDMLDTMYDAPGIGLAAPQVGRSIRLIVVDISREEDEEKQPIILFNPEIIPESELVCEEEGCLSVPGIYADVIRPDIITVKALNEKGEPIVLEKIDGLLSRCILHEVDHLEGVLFVDRLKPTDRALYENKLKKMAREEKRKLKP